MYTSKLNPFWRFMLLIQSGKMLLSHEATKTILRNPGIDRIFFCLKYLIFNVIYKFSQEEISNH